MIGLAFSAEERDQCVTLRGNLEQRYKHTEDELASLHVRLEQQIDFKKKNEELEDSITVCKSELDSLNKLDATKTATLETLRLEKDTINTQLDVKRDENKKLQEEVERVRIFRFLKEIKIRDIRLRRRLGVARKCNEATLPHCVYFTAER